ncbi:MAG: cupin domain-containing protein [Bacteroidota bacterium]
MTPINISDKFTKFSEQWSPRRVVLVDEMQVILARLQGEFVWHSHEEEDELFHVIKGTLYMQFRDASSEDGIKTVVVKEGEIIVVPKGVEHNPTTKNGEEVQVLLFEKLSTAHTGKVVHERTKTDYPLI